MQTLTPYNRPDYNDLPPQFPPDCASAWGEDQYGIWFDLSVNGVTQRFRWIPRGEFTMGSPPDEKERESYESLGKETSRDVILSRGYWIADTACTQALWLSVIDKNPSSFNSDKENPVEKVSWLDIQGFLSKLNQLMPGLNAQLPSEAQWEYACRAGTTSPFSFGENITPNQVNYDGNYPYDNGEKGEYRQKTIPVTALPANHWGLYQMHGNVWEWCFDEFQQGLGAEPVIDPVTAAFKSDAKLDSKTGRRGADAEIEPKTSKVGVEQIYRADLLENADDANVLRVLRGGSWDGYGRLCRSAIRDGYVAGYRGNFIGFRFSLGL